MPKKLYISIPKNYPVCQHSDCPTAATCLRQLSYTELLENEEYIHLINPDKCSKDLLVDIIVIISLSCTHVDLQT